MVMRHSTLFAVAVAYALAWFGGVALANDNKSGAGGWATPNVVGMPGYKEPPKAPADPKAPIPVPTVDASSASYLHHQTGDAPKTDEAPKK